MYTYEEIIEAYVALAEAEITLMKYVETTKDVTEFAVLAGIVTEFHKAKLSDKAKELYDRLLSDETLLNNKAVMDYTKSFTENHF